MQNAAEKRGLSGNALKLIAIIAMTIDHLTWTIFPGYGNEWYLYLLHAIGRITAPVMCYFIAEGYHYTHDAKRYALRLLVFALVSHFAYNFAFGIPLLPFSGGQFLNQTSVMWSLFWGLCALMLFDDERLPQWAKTVLFFAILAVSFCSDWSCIAVLCIVSFRQYRGNFKKQALALIVCTAMYAAVFCLAIDWRYGLLQMMVVLSLPFLKRYNGQRGKWRGMKWFFYLYYPLHLVVCGILRVALHGAGSSTLFG